MSLVTRFVTNRWMMWVLELLILGICFIGYCKGQGFSAIGPNTIRPNTPYSISFTNSFPCHAPVDVTLQGGPVGCKLSINQTISAIVSRRTGKSVSFEVGNIAKGNYKVLVRSKDVGIPFNEEIDLAYDGKTESIFILLDKPVYKPGDVLKFRIVVVDVNTRPASDIKTVNVTLSDANGNSIRRWPFGKLQHGVFESQVQLASSPTLGLWSFTVIAGRSKASKSLELREYVLPKYHVKVYPQRALLVTEKRIVLVVETAYTSGKPLEGSLTVDLFVDDASKRRPDYFTTKRIEGQTTVEFRLNDELEVESDSDVTFVFARVNVTETFTNRTESIVERIPVHRYPNTISVVKSDHLFSPGSLFSLQLIVQDHNGIPASDGQSATIKIIYDGDESSEESYEISLVKETDSKGVITVDIVPPRTAISFQMEITYDSVMYDNFEEIYAAQSESNQFITVTLNENRYKVRPNREVLFEISCTERMSHFAYTFWARGSIIDSGHVNVANKKRYSFRYRLLPQMAPKAKLIVTYTSKNFLIFDDLELNFDMFSNHFEFSLDDDDYLPGQDIYVDLQAANDSYVAFHAIDQSVLHLGRNGHAFTQDDVLRDLKQYGVGESDEFKPFNDMGLFVRSTAAVDFAYARNHHSRSSRSSEKIDKAPTQIRTVFPETWLWTNYSMDGKRSFMTIESVVPDTVTSWMVDGFALSPTLGLGVMKQPRVFTVYQPFYIIADLPYSIKRDEVVVIQVTVFNFLGTTLTSDVTLFNKNDEIEFVDNYVEFESATDVTLSDMNVRAVETQVTRRTKPVIVPANNGKSVSFMIKAKKLGDIAIKFEAVNTLKSDSVEHMLRVVPESHLHELNEARYIDLSETNYQKFDISINVPRNVDEGSVSVKFILDPDIFGSVVENLESLISLPCGCGEQNMIQLVPNVVVLDYMYETRTIKEELYSDLISKLTKGYENQLNYKLSDNSFAVFPEMRGCVFLTAFVAKSFAIASKYIYIDERVIEGALDWLVQTQQPDGRFEEIGDIIHVDMQGGLETSCFSLTAYVLIALLESKSVSGERWEILQKSADYLTTGLDSINNPYDLALATYALSLKDRNESLPFLDKLVEFSQYDEATGTRSWSYRSLGVEIAGYALLSYIEHGLVPDATPIMRWLTTQRYDRGGFMSTQDTFVALKAMAKFSARVSTHRNDYRVAVIPKRDKMYLFDVDSQSLNTLKQNLESTTRKVQVELLGKGAGIFQISYQYYQNIVVEKSSFNLEVNLLPNSTYYRQELNVCVSFNAKEAYEYSNMALVEVFFPSGLVADKNSVRDLSIGRNIKKTELRFGGTSLVVYYIRLNAQPNCFVVSAERHFKVALHRPAHVVVYDYYDNGAQSDRFAIATYEGKVMQMCDVCDDEDCETLSCP
ncbi:hypothetical protein quinque_010822 [Culex quinquefasciatus]